MLLVPFTTHFCHTSQSNWQMARYCFIEQWKKTALNDYLKTFSQLMRHTLTELLKKYLFIVFYMLTVFGWFMLRSVVNFYAVVKDYLLLYDDCSQLVTVNFPQPAARIFIFKVSPSSSRLLSPLQNLTQHHSIYVNSNWVIRCWWNSHVTNVLQPISTSKKKIVQIFCLTYY